MNPTSGITRHAASTVSPPRVPANAPIRRVDEPTINVKLHLIICGVPDTHRTRAAVTLEMIEHRLGQVAPAIDAVQTLQFARRACLFASLHHPAPERSCFLCESD